MNTLIRHIEYLISRKDCVIIPDFGAILASNVSAKHDVITHTITPPARVFTFNSDLKHNDGLLVTSIQRAEGISYESALRRVQAAVDSMSAMLKYKGELAIGRIGTVTLDVDTGVMTFVSNHSESLNPSALWLPTLSLTTVDDVNIIDAPIEHKPQSWYRRIGKAAASIALLIGICFVASTPLTVDDAMMASLAPEVSQISTDDIVPANDEPATLTVTLPSTTDSLNIDTVPDTADVVDSPVDQYFVVVASVASEADAYRYMNESADARLRLFARGKYFRLYTSAHPSVGEAYRASLEEQSKYPGAWVCKK